jgi:hypothetical protein
MALQSNKTFDILLAYPDKLAAHSAVAPDGDRDPELDCRDREVLNAFTRFNMVEAELDRLVGCDAVPSDDVFLALHRQWSQAVAQAFTLPACTIEGQRAKKAMLFKSLRLVLGINPSGAAPVGNRLAWNINRSRGLR